MADSRPPTSPSLALPWPGPDEVRGLAVRTVVRDPVWMASLRNEVVQWRASRAKALPLFQYERLSQLTGGSVEVVEIAEEHLLSAASWLTTPRSGPAAVVALLPRTARCSPDERAAMATLLVEAGASCVLAGPRDASELAAVFDQVGQWHEANESDPLDTLPLPCWDPAWQRSRGRIGLST
jgi:hypothetical protein